MADRIHVVPANLREAAGHHQETSEYLRTLPSSHQAIQQSLDSLGPIFGELREELRTGTYLTSKTDIAAWLRTRTSAVLTAAP